MLHREPGLDCAVAGKMNLRVGVEKGMEAVDSATDRSTVFEESGDRRLVSEFFLMNDWLVRGWYSVDRQGR